MAKVETDILDSLEGLQYPSEKFTIGALNEGLASKEFTDVVSWLSAELSTLNGFEERVHPLENPEDSNSFMMELSSFLKECECPYPSLMEVPVSERLSTIEQRSQLLDFLCTELQASRLIAKKEIAEATRNAEPAKMKESETASDLRLMCQALGFSKPPDTITSQQLFTKIIAKVKEQIASLPKELMKKSLVDPGALLSSQQWEILESFNEDLKAEYKMRFELLLKRLDVSVTSFTWCDRVKKMEDDLAKIYRPKRIKLMTDSHIGVADVLAAREDLLTIEKTCGSKARENTQTKVNKVLMKGKLPDRGGRPDQIKAPPPEMPPWQKDRAQPSDGRGGRGGRGGPGGRIQRGGRGGSHGYAGFHGNNPGGGGYQQGHQQQGGYGAGGFQQQGGSYQNNQGGSYYQHDTRSGGYQQQQGNYGGSYTNHHQGGGDFQRYGGGGQPQTFHRGGGGRGRRGGGNNRYRE